MKIQLRTDWPGKAPAMLAALCKAFACARDLQIDPWEFSLPLPHLVDNGVGKSDLRWLVLHGYVTCRDRARRFQPDANVTCGSDPRFLITEAGGVAAGLEGDGANFPPSIFLDPTKIRSPGSCLPHWDRKLRQLSFDGCVVKRFRLPASNQAAVLSMFEEEGWPPSIDDPLPFLSTKRCKERLHATIRCLNANHENRLVRFRGDGTGEAVLWEPVAAVAVDPSTVTLGLVRAA
ncbi:MAG: hypothetical protein WCJ35_15850 [Planctomycetota bacterium]